MLRFLTSTPTWLIVPIGHSEQLVGQGGDSVFVYRPISHAMQEPVSVSRYVPFAHEIVGITVGCGVGCDVGCGDGAAVGSGDGSGNGSSVGSAVGTTVGCGEGSG